MALGRTTATRASSPGLLGPTANHVFQHLSAWFAPSSHRICPSSLDWRTVLSHSAQTSCLSLFITPLSRCPWVESPFTSPWSSNAVNSLCRNLWRHGSTQTDSASQFLLTSTNPVSCRIPPVALLWPCPCSLWHGRSTLIGTASADAASSCSAAPVATVSFHTRTAIVSLCLLKSPKLV